MNKSTLTVTLSAVTALALLPVSALRAQSPSPSPSASPSPAVCECGAEHHHHHGNRGWKRDPMEKLTKKLDLTQAEQQQIAPVAAPFIAQLKTIQKGDRAQFKSVLLNLNQAIRPYLDATQQAKIDQIDARLQK